MPVKYKWIVAEEIPVPGYKKKGKYEECVEEFLQSSLEAARVNIPNAKLHSVNLLLRHYIKKKCLNSKIKACIRGDKVFLFKLK